MCMIDGGEKAEVWSESVQRARKEYKCEECYRTIAIGEKYWRVFGVSEGDVFTGKWCSHCNVGKEWLWENCGGYILSCVIEDCEQHVDEYRRAEFTPALARICVGARRHWVIEYGPRKGQLMPLPKMPGRIHEHTSH